MIYSNITQLIGSTPIIKVNKLDEDMADIYAKLEYFNPAGSVKDRAAYYMIKGMEEKNLIKKGDTIVEATSGNTGIGLAMASAALGYKSLFVMPESMSIERRKLLSAYGGKLVLTDAKEGMQGAVDKAEELSQKDGFIMARQFTNKDNSRSHYETTAKEIMADFETLDAFVAGVGSGGTITGVAKKLKENNYKTKFYAVEPKSSPLLTKNKTGSHKIQGIGANFVPEVLDINMVDEVMDITDDESYEMARDFAVNQGVLIGISSGAAYAASLKVAKKLGRGKKVLFIAPDSGERYLSTDLY